MTAGGFRGSINETLKLSLQAQKSFSKTALLISPWQPPISATTITTEEEATASDTKSQPTLETSDIQFINIQLFTAEECGGFGGGAFVYVRSSCSEQTQT